MKSLPASITSMGENSVLNIAASSNKGLLIRFLNEQVEEGFYVMVIDYLKDNDLDLSTMVVDDEIKNQCTKLYELAEFVNVNIRQAGKVEIEEWIEPLFKFVYGDINPTNIDSAIATTGIYRFSVWLVYLYQRERFAEAIKLIGERVAPLLINSYFQILESEDRPKCFDKAVMGYLDLFNVVMEMDIPASTVNTEYYLNNLEVFYDYLVEDDNVANDYKIQFSIGLFNEYIKSLDFEKAFEFYGLNAEYIPVDNLKVYDSFKKLINNCQSTQYTNVLNRAVVTALSKQDIYNRRIDSLISEVSSFVRKVCKYVEDEPTMKRNLQILGVGTSLSDKSNVFEGLYEYNLVFYDCGIKALVNQDMAARSWEEKYEILDMLYTTLNVIFDGYNVYELSNKIEHQYVELNWIGSYVNSSPTLLKSLFSIKEKIKAFKIRKNSIVEKSKVNHEIKKLLEDRQKHLVFMAADDMIMNGLNNKSVAIINGNYDTKKAEKMLIKTFGDTVIPSKYKSKTVTNEGRFSFGKSAPVIEDELKKLLANPNIAEMLYKAEWLWNQYVDKGKDMQTEDESTYSVACLIKAIEYMVVRRGGEVKREDNTNKRVIITKTGKVIELSDGASEAPVNKKAEPNIIEYIDNIGNSLIENTDSNITYVKGYIEEWVKYLMDNKFDKDTKLSINEAEEFRSRTYQVLKRLSYDMIAFSFR